MEAMSPLQTNAITETFNDVTNLINKAAWNFYKSYGGDFEEWRAEANFTFIQIYNRHEKSKGQFTAWLYRCIWKRLLTYSKELSRQEPKAVTIEEDVEYRKKDSFSPLELLDGIQEDTRIIIRLIWNPPRQLKKIETKNGPHSCHTKVVLRNYLFNLGWTGRRIKESFEEIARLIND